jgi:hypothetical protein
VFKCQYAEIAATDTDNQHNSLLSKYSFSIVGLFFAES